MKKNRLLSGFLVVVLLVFSFGGAAFADAHENIVDVAIDDGNFTVLVDALVAAELDGVLADEDAEFTVFAPTDDAFTALLQSLDEANDEVTYDAAYLLGHPDLADVLLFHVVQDAVVMAGDLEAGDNEVSTLNGDFVINVDGDDVTIMVDGEMAATITATDVGANNGVIHVLDTVLIPEGFEPIYEVDEDEDGEELQNIVEIAQGDDDFSILVEALVAADLVSALEGEGPFTVFAPTNDAFAKLLEALDIDKDELLAHPDLAAVLLYHVVEGAVFAEDLEEGMEPETLQGETVMISLEGGVFVNDSQVIAADIEASNGVIHAIDEVLVPEAFGAEEEVEDEDETPVPVSGDIGILPFVLAGAAGLSGLWIVKKRK